MTRWIGALLWPDGPQHVTTFHPDYRMLDVPPTCAPTPTRARRIAPGNGLRYVSTGSVHDGVGGSKHCHACGRLVIGRDGYRATAWHVTSDGCCDQCGAALLGGLEPQLGDWGPKRQPVRLGGFR